MTHMLFIVGLAAPCLMVGAVAAPATEAPRVSQAAMSEPGGSPTAERPDGLLTDWILDRLTIPLGLADMTPPPLWS